jgi:hypothetical protein
MKPPPPVGAEPRRLHVQADRAADVPSLPGLGVDVLPGLVVAGLLVALLIWDPVLAGQLVREDSVVEWLQVAVAGVALAFVLAGATRGVSTADVLLASLLCAMMASEVELDQRIFGIPVIDPRFFRRAAVPGVAKVVAGALIVGVPLALCVYAIRRRRDLWAEAQSAARDGWLRVLVMAIVFIAIAEIWERPLNRPGPFPKYFLEEGLEILGAVYLALAMVRRWAARRLARHPASLLLARHRENLEPD